MKLRYWLAFIVASIAGVVTVVPAPASRPCLLGYYAHCSWTPLSTLICLGIAGAIMWVGERRVKP